MSFNRITIVGNLGKDPELKYTPQGKAVCEFSVATNDRRKDKKGEMREVPIWFTVTLWEKRAEVASKHLKKGDQVYVEGQLGLDEWIDKDNNGRVPLEVKFADFQFIGKGPNGGEES